MAKRKNRRPPETITETLKRTIVESGLTMSELERRSGALRPSLIRFMQGKQSLRLDIADRLAAAFGLSLKP